MNQHEIVVECLQEDVERHVAEKADALGRIRQLEAENIHLKAALLRTLGGTSAGADIKGVERPGLNDDSCGSVSEGTPPTSTRQKRRSRLWMCLAGASAPCLGGADTTVSQQAGYERELLQLGAELRQCYEQLQAERSERTYRHEYSLQEHPSEISMSNMEATQVDVLHEMVCQP